MKRKINNKLAYCIIVLILIFITGCGNDSKELTSQRIAERPLSPPRTIEPVAEVNETENEPVDVAVEVNDSALQEKRSKYRPVKAVGEENTAKRSNDLGVGDVLSFIDNFNESAYEKIPLQQVEKSTTYKYSSFDMSILDKLVYFEGRVFPEPITSSSQDTTIGIILSDGSEDASLNGYDFLLNNSINLTCQLGNFKILHCNELEPFAEYRLYGIMLLADNNYGISALQVVKFDLHALKKIGEADTQYLLDDSYYCSSDADCQWVSVNCCPQTAGAEWVCSNKQIKTHLCSQGWRTCNEVMSPIPTTACTCQEGKCVG